MGDDDILADRIERADYLFGREAVNNFAFTDIERAMIVSALRASPARLKEALREIERITWNGSEQCRIARKALDDGGG